MIKAYSQRLMPPYSGQVQIAETARARALTLDGKSWEIHFLQNAEVDDSKAGKFTHRRFIRVTVLEHGALESMLASDPDHENEVDERIRELAEFLVKAELPFPSNDVFEYWLLDPADDSPLALIFSCSDEELQGNFPSKTDWMSLPAAVMPVDYKEGEREHGTPPVNYRVEMMVSDRAGYSPKAKWFRRSSLETEAFPPLMVREDWSDQENHDLCQRYIERQSPRLLMLHGLQREVRERLEISAKPYALEVARFHKLYPDIVDRQLMNAILVEARLRATA
jgi:hypothetical protein